MRYCSIDTARVDYTMFRLTVHFCLFVRIPHNNVFRGVEHESHAKFSHNVCNDLSPSGLPHGLMQMNHLAPLLIPLHHHHHHRRHPSLVLLVPSPSSDQNLTTIPLPYPRPTFHRISPSLTPRRSD